MGGNSKEKEKKGKEEKPSSSTSYNLPPVVEWLSFTCEQSKAIVDVLKRELDTVLNEYVDKNLDQLLKEDYVSARLTETIVKQFSQLTTKTIVNLQDQNHMAWKEVYERFPLLKRRDSEEYLRNITSLNTTTASSSSEYAIKHEESKTTKASNSSSKSTTLALRSANSDEEDDSTTLLQPISSKEEKSNLSSSADDESVPSPAEIVSPNSPKANEEVGNVTCNLTIDTALNESTTNNLGKKFKRKDAPPISPAETVAFQSNNKNKQKIPLSSNVNDNDENSLSSKNKSKEDEKGDGESVEEENAQEWSDLDNEEPIIQNDSDKETVLNGSESEEDTSKKAKDTLKDKKSTSSQNKKDKKKKNKGKDDDANSQKDNELFEDSEEDDRPVSPAETVRFNNNNNTNKTSNSNEFKKPSLIDMKPSSSKSSEKDNVGILGRMTRAVSPCDTVVVSLKKKPASPPLLLPLSSPKPTSKTSSIIDSPPSPPETVVFEGKKKKQDASSTPTSSLKETSKDDTDKPSTSKKSKKSDDDNKDNDEDEEEDVTKNKALDSDSDSDETISLFSLQSKKAKKSVNDKGNKSASSEDEDDDTIKNKNKVNLKKKKSNEDDDPKLFPNDKKNPVVCVERLSELIYDRLQTQKFIKIPKDDDDDKNNRRRGRKGRKDEDPLAAAIRQLCAYDPVQGDKTRDRSRKRTKDDSKNSKHSKKKQLRDAESDSDIEEEPRVKVSKPNIEPVVIDCIDSDAEDLDGGGGSDSDSSTKRDALKSSKKKIKDESGAENKKKKKGGNYYTPAVCELGKIDDDSDAASSHSDDDDFVSVKKKKSKGKVFTVDSDSEDSSKAKKKKKSSSSSVEEIESDSSDNYKRKSKRKRRNRSDSSDASDSDDKRKSRRKRVKELSDSDSDESFKSKKKKKKNQETRIDDSDSDIEIVENSQTSPTRGRKNIRSVMSKRDLQKQTRQAEDEEDKRKRRVAERQKQFNAYEKLPEAESMEVLDSLVLDRDLKTNEVLVQVDAQIVNKLKPHQAKGVLFLWDSTFESVEQYKKPNNQGSGCILAHCMGLGKTLQTIAFLHTVLQCKQLEIKSALVICPLNTVGNWFNEIKQWTREAEGTCLVHKLYDEKNLRDRIHALQVWKRRGGIGIIHYDCFRALVGDGKPQKAKAKLSKAAKDLIAKRPIIQECLLDYPDIVVCDEGHLLKNHTSKTSLAVNQLKTRRRIVLTGTPLQNNLMEYHTMMNFVKPNLLGTRQEFSNRFVNPITNGQHADSDEHDVARMKKRAHVLHKLLDGCVQRLDYSVLVPYLPPKHEYVVLIKLSDIQSKLYAHYLESIKSETNVGTRIKERKFFCDFAALCKVWSHPYALVLKNTEKESDADSMGSMKDFIDDDDDDEESSSTSAAANDDSDIDWLDDDCNIIDNKKKKKSKVKKENGKDEEVVEEEKQDNEGAEKSSYDVIQQGGDWWSKFFKSKDDICLLENSSKLSILFEILKTCEQIGDKVLVFSQYLDSLNIIETFLEDLDADARKNGSPIRWRKQIEYFRIDGATKTEDRQRDCDIFNKKTTDRVKLFLISTKAGGLGINLVGANRVVIFDASWNPSQDLQSIFRVFRFGQQKPCYVYRLLAQGTMEEKIYNRQVVKLSLSGRVVDEHQIERHFKFDEMRKMYDFDPNDKPDRPTPPVPKDRLLADLLISHKDMIDTYLEHDSLLQNQADEGLTEDERKVAWEEYQREKDYIATQATARPNVDTQREAERRIYDRLRTLYPTLPPYQLNYYFEKLNGEMLELRNWTNSFHIKTPTFTDEQRIACNELINKRRERVQHCLVTPNFVLSAFPPPPVPNQQDTYANYLRQLQQSNYSSNSYNTGNSTSPGIQIAPMSSILERPGTSSSFLNVSQNVLDSQNQQPNGGVRPGILNRNRTIPTVPTPYNPVAQ